MPEIILQPAAAAGVDTHIDEGNANTNFAADNLLDCYYLNTGDNRDVLLKFDLTSIAKGSKIQEAILTLHVDGFISLAMQADLWRILPANSDWTEAGATWNNLDGANPWAGAAGCETVAVDYAAGPLYEMAIDFILGDNVFILNASEFQALIDVGNYGMILKGHVRNPAINRGVQIVSSDHVDATDRPELFIRWIEPSGRLFEYKFNKFDPEKKIYGPTGEEVQPNEIRPDNWVFTEGYDLPSGKVYASLIPHPGMDYIVGSTDNEDGQLLAIETDRNQFADAIINRLIRGV